MIVKSVNCALVLTLLLYWFFAGGLLASDQKLLTLSSSFSPIGYLALHIEDGENVNAIWMSAGLKKSSLISRFAIESSSMMKSMISLSGGIIIK